MFLLAFAWFCIGIFYLEVYISLKVSSIKVFNACRNTIREDVSNTLNELLLTNLDLPVVFIDIDIALLNSFTYTILKIGRFTRVILQNECLAWTSG